MVWNKSLKLTVACKKNMLIMISNNSARIIKGGVNYKDPDKKMKGILHNPSTSKSISPNVMLYSLKSINFKRGKIPKYLIALFLVLIFF